MAATIDVVEFEIRNSLYALDIGVAREIVEMMPITPIPRAPHYLAGVINLRGELTYIIDLTTLLNLASSGETSGNRKIIVLIPEAAGDSNVGIIVDEVHSVIKVPKEDTETMDGSISSAAYIKGIIKLGRGEGAGKHAEKDLVIWIDVPKILADQVGRGHGTA